MEADPSRKVWDAIHLLNLQKANIERGKEDAEETVVKAKELMAAASRLQVKAYKIAALNLPHISGRIEQLSRLIDDKEDDDESEKTADLLLPFVVRRPADADLSFDDFSPMESSAGNFAPTSQVVYCSSAVHIYAVQPHVDNCPVLVELSSADGKKSHIELRCYECGGNASRGTNALLKGVMGFQRHLKQAHGVKATLEEVVNICNYRQVPDDEVARVKRGRSELDLIFCAKSERHEA